jgi:hypothetical protein
VGTKPSAAGVNLAGSPATLVLRTVPAIKRVRVTLDGITRFTDANGLVEMPTISGAHHIDVRPPQPLPAGAVLHFSRWLDGLVLASRWITLSPGINRDQVGFVSSHRIAVRFTDANGQPVPVTEVSRITVTSSLGRRFTFPPAHPPSTMTVYSIIRVGSSLRDVRVRYSVRQVLIDHSNVVYGGSQNFFISAHPRTWTVKVLLFPLRIEVRDALFGFPTGSSVRVTLPDGGSRVVALQGEHAVILAELPRATYQLLPVGPGLGLSAPARLSKAQTARLLLLSWVDIGTLAGAAVLFLLGLPLLGGRIVRRPGGRFRPSWHAYATRGGPPASGASSPNAAERRKS